MTRSPQAVKTAARSLTGILLICGVLTCSADHVVFARHDGPQFPAGAQPHLTSRNSSSAMQLHVDDESAVPQFDTVRLPPNLIVSAPLQRTVESMLRGSPTFRRQCARLADASSLTVSLEHVLIAARAKSQALTDVTVDRDGRMRARVQLGQAQDREEAIAHEFEHIIEQLDGVDLASLARQSTAAVRFRDEANRFETERALATGRQVAREIRMAGRKRM
jgi:ribosomal protein L18